MCNERLNELRVDLKLSLERFMNNRESSSNLNCMVSDIIDGRLERIKERDLILAVTYLLPHRKTNDLELFIVEDKENIIDMFLAYTVKI